MLLRTGTLTKHNDRKHWRFTDYAAGESGEKKVALLGRIPYEYIDNVEWDGDEYYGVPHLFCFFANKKEPYDNLALYAKITPIAKEDLPIYEEVVSLDDARRFSKKSHRFG